MKRIFKKKNNLSKMHRKKSIQTGGRGQKTPKNIALEKMWTGKLTKMFEYDVFQILLKSNWNYRKINRCIRNKV